MMGYRSQSQAMTKSVASIGQKKSIASMTSRHAKSISSMGGGQGKSLSRMKVRKRSYGFGNVSGIKQTDQSSQLVMEYRRPPLMYLNTYQLEPRVRFHPANVEKTIDAVLDAYFSDYKYNKSDSPILTLAIAGEIMRNVKNLGFNRYRIIAVVTLAQRRAQSYSNAVAFLWDHDRDGVVNVYREVNSAFIQITVFGVYLD